MDLDQAQATLNATDFSNLEKIIKTELPKDFKKFYTKNNGGFIPEKSFKTKQSPLHGFYPIKYGLLPIESLLKDYSEQAIQFGKKIPFAYDAGGNLFVLSLENDETYGKVFFIGHEFLDEQNYQFVSNSFTEFIDKFI